MDETIRHAVNGSMWEHGQKRARQYVIDFKIYSANIHMDRPARQSFGA